MQENLFHPVVSSWFQSQFEEASPIQEQAWPVIKERKHALIAAPTGSGKTLAAFLASIDDLVRQSIDGTLTEGTQVVYVSPLKALSNDIEANLQIPLAGIQQQLVKNGLPEAPIRVMVRTGDTPASVRASMTRNPPHILVTTPESLYLLLTSEGGRRMMTGVNTLIVDEIHALVGNKRGSHLALSVERLERLTDARLMRIGISATQKPIETIAHFLTGSSYRNGDGCTILDTGHQRHIELDIEVPRSPLTAVMANEVWQEIYERLEQLILKHRTTLIFVTTRSMSERLAHHLSEKLGLDIVTAHHGSMSKEHRHDAEQRLKAGSLRALIATASLELGIDIGSVDLVCQIGSPKSIAAFLQRVGRSGHTLAGTPRGRLFPLTRDELVEGAAILDAVRRGELDKVIIPEQPLDVLSQQIIAEVANGEFTEDELFQMTVRAYPYRDLTREEFDDVITMLSEGYTPRRGRSRSYVHRDLINGTVKGRKGARFNALMSGGTIPDQFDYDVILEPSETFIGTLNEDFAIESTSGDIVQLGNNSWRILRVERGKIRVEDANGQPPTMPFWFGEAPARTAELSESVSRLREEVSKRTGTGPETSKNGDPAHPVSQNDWKQQAETWLTEEVGVPYAAADQIVGYLGASEAALGVMPSQNDLVAERFFDEAGDMHLVVHTPFGSRVNRAWGLALRKRFCRQFNFELQAAANEDAIVLSLGATHSFPLDDVFKYLNAASVRQVLTQAMLDAPMFEVRWRWNASIALAIQRRRGGERVPPQIQRSQSEDLIALVFPDQLACLENIAGDREIPNHPLVNQTVKDCLYQAMDIEKLESILTDIKSERVRVHARDMRAPSPMSEEILNARPYAFLDDAPLEERRTNAVRNRRWLDPSEAADLGRLDPDAVRTVQADAWPEVRDPDELHDALILTGYLTEQEGIDGDEFGSWAPYFETLLGELRAMVLITGSGARLWVALERRIQLELVYPDATFMPAEDLPVSVRKRLMASASTMDEASALVEITRGRLEALGPITAEALAQSADLPVSTIEVALMSLENEGFVFRGQYSPGIQGLEWCERRLLARIHRFTISKLRREIQPVSAADYMRFLFEWQHVAPDSRMKGPDAVAGVLGILEGIEAPAAAWESEILPSRVADYDYNWLDSLCQSGRFAWGRFRPYKSNGESNRSIGPVKTTPIAIVDRGRVAEWVSLSGAPDREDIPLSTNARKVLALFDQGGALFYDDIANHSRLLPTQTEDAISELVSAGLVTSDSFSGLRALLVPGKRKESRRGRRPTFDMSHAGRWGLISGHTPPSEPGEMLEAYVRTVLQRYGVVFRRITERESLAPPWRELVRILRRMEARGEVRGGRFVNGVWGEQFALSEAITALRGIRRKEKDGTLVAISAADPLNLIGILTQGRRIPALTKNRILYRDGEPIMIMEGGEMRPTAPLESKDQWSLQNVLIKREFPPKLKAYLGTGVV